MARMIDGAMSLLEAGFEYAINIDEFKLFRK